jgi:hydroxymethylglutaryl-CoA reductase
MAIEEPSVVAAASSAAKLVASHGGFHTYTSGNIMTSQIQLLDTPDIPSAIAAIESHRESLIDYANKHLCASMKRRGGGVLHIYSRVIDHGQLSSASPNCKKSQSGFEGGWYQGYPDELIVQSSSVNAKALSLVVHIDVDVCEAMGANVVNTVAEGLSGHIARITESRAGLRILTNLCRCRRARASFSIPVAALAWKGATGPMVAQRIIEVHEIQLYDLGDEASHISTICVRPRRMTLASKIRFVQ